MVDTVYQKISMPNDPVFIRADGTVNPVWLNFLGQIVKMAQALSTVPNMAPAASLAPTAFGAVAATYTRAGATYTTAELSTALDEIKNTLIPALSANALASQALMATLIAGQKTAQQMET